MIPPEDKKVNSKVKMDAVYCQTDDKVSSSSWNSKFAKQKHHKICLLVDRNKIQLTLCPQYHLHITILN